MEYSIEELRLTMYRANLLRMVSALGLGLRIAAFHSPLTLH